MKRKKGMERNYDDLSRDELVAIIGGEVDPELSRADLIMLAKERDKRDMQAM